MATLAKKVGIDITKITLQEVQPKIKTTEVKLELKKEFKPTEENLKSKSDIPHVKEVKNLVSKEVDSAKIIKQETKIQENFVVEEKKVELPKEIKSTPIFKPQISAEHTTEQLVQVKQLKVEQKTPKDRANETLKLLLRGEKPSSEAQNLTADFSVETAKVIAPKATTEDLKELGSLLHDKTKSSEENSVSSKIEPITVHKADSFEVKLNEAKQMIKYLSQDVKTAIEDYKSPFTRVRVQLNPQRLGEIDLTVVQRGKNLHVNLNSNSSAITTLSMNATELRVQLQNSGINNATLNFSSNSQGNDSHASGQQNHQNEKQAEEEYSYLQNEETNEELLNSLEIVIPRYI